MKQNKAFVAGITGPAGCGKSYICKSIAQLTDTLIIDTDSIAREQSLKGGSSYRETVDEFGSDILLENGEINRAKLAALVFNDSEKLKKLNSITHPNVIKEAKRLIADGRAKYQLIIVESAILTAAHCDEFCDEVWYVYSTIEERRERLITTRGYSAEKIKSLMKSQNSDKYFREHSDAVINNRTKISAEKLNKSLMRLLKKKNIKIQKSKLIE